MLLNMFGTALRALVEEGLSGFPVIDEEWNLVTNCCTHFLVEQLKLGCFNCLCDLLF